MRTKLLFILLSKTFLSVSLSVLIAQTSDTIRKVSFNEIKSQVDFNKGFIADPLQLLSGKASGVSITKKGSNPNIANNIYIRGITSNFFDGPLFIIDGAWGADPQFLIPDEIESMEILKDAASTAAYGSRGMTGVIIINTKSALGNKPFSMDFNSYMSLNTVAKRMNLLTADELRNVVTKNNLFFDDGGASTDWQDEIFRNTISQNYHLSAFGQVKNTGYRLSFNQRGYPGIVLGTDRRNTNLNLKVSRQALNNRLNVNASAGVRNGASNTVPNYYGMDRYNIFYQAYQRNPTDPVFDADGTTYAQFPRVFSYNNPLAIISFTGNESSSSVMSYSLNASYRITNGLYLDFNAGHSMSKIRNNRYEKPEALYIGFGNFESLQNSEFERLNMNPGVSFSTIFNQKHQVVLRAGYVYGMYINKYSYWYKDTSTEYRNNNYNKPVFNSVIASVWYEYAERYFVNALWNREGYSFFSSSLEQLSLDPIKRVNHYPSITAGWKIHNEIFMNRFEIISNLILKGGFGYSGNSNFHLIYPSALTVNTDNLETEQMKEFSIGLDYGLWDNRITGSFAYYSRSANNILGHRSVPSPPNPQPFIYSNDFHYKNKGVELSLNALAIKNEKLSWNTSFVYFQNHNELVSGLLQEDGIRTGYINYYHLTDNSYTQLLRTAGPPSVFYLPVLAGISDDGNQLYYTENGNVTRQILMAKREQMGQLIPRQELGWVNRVSFMQRFDLELSIRYVGGHSIFNATRMAMSNSFLLPVLNVIPEGVNNYDIGKQYNAVCDFYLENASYLRLDNITFGYTIQPRFNTWEGNLRLFFSANNLFTITKYSGLDPAYDYHGIDYYNVYPLARSFVFGVKLKI